MTKSETKKVVLQGEFCDGHEFRIVNRFNNLAIQSGEKPSLSLGKLGDKIEVSATFTTAADTARFKEALDVFVAKDKSDHAPSVYKCKFTTMVI